VVVKLAAVLFGVSVLAASATAPAQGRACTEAIADWASRCAHAERIELSPSHCPPGRIVVRAEGDAPTSVELGAATRSSFRRAGEIGLSPIGEFADWSKEPPARRRALEALEACVAREPPPLGFAQPAGAAARPPVPWLFVGGFLALAIACGARVRKLDKRRALLVGLAISAAVGAVLGLRWALLPGAFFHQNGHGATWIAYALRDQRGLSAYGPGYAELFGWAALAAGSEPERGVFALQSVLSALSVPCAFFVARGCGAKPVLAAALALGVALDPLLARLAQSESYFAAFVGLAFLAATALAQAGRRVRSVSFVAAVAAAGLLTAQAARIHPLGWVAFALLPLVALCARGRLRARLIRTGVASAAIASVVLLSSGGVLHDVLRGSLGAQWLPGVLPEIARGLPWIVAAMIVIALVARAKSVTLLAAAAAGALGLIWVTNILSEPSFAVARAYERPFWAVLVALVAALGVRFGRQRLVAAGVLVAGILAAALQLRAATELPTDAREAKLAIAWRRGLPEGAVVAYVERVDHQISTLPLYEGVTAARPFPIRLGQAQPPNISELGAPVYYYRSSVCASPNAATRCAELERSVRLELVHERALPALPSMRWNPYAPGPVRVALFRRL
jgi:hypothetical protein